jgi:hypothetical protein
MVLILMLYNILFLSRKKQNRQRQIPINPTLEATIINEFEKLIITHIIFPVKYSKWVSNVVPVQKKTGDIRLCLDFRALNRASVKYIFPLPNMELIFQQVEGAQMISLIFSGYNQIRVKRENKYKTTFTTLIGAPLHMKACLLV